MFVRGHGTPPYGGELLIKMERVSKKTKPNSFPRCSELCLKGDGDQSPVMYLFSISEVYYKLLDRRWVLIQTYDHYPEEVTQYFNVHLDNNYPPMHFEAIKNAQKSLGKELATILRGLYCDKGPLDWWKYLNMREIPPHNVIIRFGTKGVQTLIRRYDNCESDEHRDLILFTLFKFLKQPGMIKPFAPMLFGSVHYSYVVRIMSWKGFIHPSEHHYIFDYLYGKEDAGLMLIACARNSPRGDNVFAQLPKDVLFKKIYPLIRWTLPFDI